MTFPITGVLLPRSFLELVFRVGNVFWRFQAIPAVYRQVRSSGFCFLPCRDGTSSVVASVSFFFAEKSDG